MSQYTVVGPDGRLAEPVELSTLQTWASTGQLPPHAPIVLPDGRRVTAGEIAELGPALDHAMGQTTMAYKPAGTKLMPTQNPSSLWGYYSGIISMLPLLGAVAVPIALIMSARGLKAYNANPEIYGKAHAITGLITGTIGLVINGLILVAMVAAYGSSSVA